MGRAAIIGLGPTLLAEVGVGAVAAVPKARAEPGATFKQVFGVKGPGARAAAQAAR